MVNIKVLTVYIRKKEHCLSEHYNTLFHTSAPCENHQKSQNLHSLPKQLTKEEQIGEGY